MVESTRQLHATPRHATIGRTNRQRETNLAATTNWKEEEKEGEENGLVANEQVVGKGRSSSRSSRVVAAAAAVVVDLNDAGSTGATVVSVSYKIALIRE